MILDDTLVLHMLDLAIYYGFVEKNATFPSMFIVSKVATLFLLHKICYMELKNCLNRCLQELKLELSPPNSSTSRLAYPELQRNDLAYYLKTWVYFCCRRRALVGDDDAKQLVQNICNAANHCAGLHDDCALVEESRPCFLERWGLEHQYYKPNGETHKAVQHWLKSHFIEAKFRHYIRARENYLSESFCGLINRYATKRTHFPKSHLASLALAALDWNENRKRTYITVREAKDEDNSIRRRPTKRKDLEAKLHSWKVDVLKKILF
jgi:hypothetical protein